MASVQCVACLGELGPYDTSCPNCGYPAPGGRTAAPPAVAGQQGRAYRETAAAPGESDQSWEPEYYEEGAGAWEARRSGFDLGEWLQFSRLWKVGVSVLIVFGILASFKPDLWPWFKHHPPSNVPVASSHRPPAPPVPSGLPKGVPADLPVFPGAKLVASREAGASGPAALVVFTSATPATQVEQFYGTAFYTGGWKVTSGFQATAVPGEATARASRGSQSIVVGVSSLSGQSSLVTVTVLGA